MASPHRERLRLWGFRASGQDAAMGMLDGELAIVTGGASGIGRATAARMVEEGASVAIIDADGFRLLDDEDVAARAQDLLGGAERGGNESREASP